VLANAKALLERLDHGPHVVLFHGHRHTRMEARAGDMVQVVSAPSTTLGDETSGRGPGFAVVSLSRTNLGIELAQVEWISVDA
jgi:hypothetical protein